MTTTVTVVWRVALLRPPIGKASLQSISRSMSTKVLEIKDKSDLDMLDVKNA